ncbi:cupin domain-containing protein [Marihabitans asiaticum]|uniref:Quercetin dioxygenase-like cupin family protein n=1 Tax=Marihabitans asiaticum TaxID=415218 RepID=A0A560W895_9MICO|nr:cupin domain-containing protein [Marihabitans asiaticum]TWD13841.1 hypothetical protein FB557_2482 [Marihabitans asiaticum]
MESLSITAVADELSGEAASASAGRSTRVITKSPGGLRQMLLALAAGRGLSEHQNPGQATLQVLRGAVRLTAGEESWDGSAGDYLVIPERTHDLQASEDSVVLLTFVTG